ncbi:MAG: HD domain-containing protein [Candidatus Omnitrophica bacterium]|nr:HD domain-containing protein [Candidatus Omnitrophota bacterium]
MQARFGNSEHLTQKKCFSIITRKDSPCESCPVIKSLKDKKVHTCDVKTMVTPSGKIKYFKITATPILNKDGEVENVLESFVDITEKRKRRMKHRIRSVEARRLNEEISKLVENFKKIENRHSARLKLATKELDTIYKLGNRIISSLDVKEILKSIVETVPELLRMSGCVVRIFEGSRKKLILEAASGVSKSFKQSARILPAGEGISGIVANMKKPMVIKDISKDARIKYHGECLRESMHSLLAVPIIFKNTVLGVIIAFSRKIKNFKASEVNLLSTFAAHVAIALNNAMMYEKVHLNYYNTIMTLVKTIEARDPYTCGHSERVTGYALKLAHKLNLSKEEIDILMYSGKLHDIGKIAIPDFILRKKSKLTPTEWAEIESHPVIGSEMIVHLSFLKDCIPLIRHHHERYDGNGYPDKLRENNIPFLARILSIADAFDAMTSERPYRRSLTLEQAKEEIKFNSKTQFDPDLAEVFLSIIEESSDVQIINNGSCVKFDIAS